MFNQTYNDSIKLINIITERNDNMSYPDFYKLKLLEKDGKRIHTIPEGRKVPFEAIGTIDPEDVQKVLDFSLDMAYGEGHHRDHRRGGEHKRTPNEIFISDIQESLQNMPFIIVLKIMV